VSAAKHNSHRPGLAPALGLRARALVLFSLSLNDHDPTISPFITKAKSRTLAQNERKSYMRSRLRPFRCYGQFECSKCPSTWWC